MQPKLTKNIQINDFLDYYWKKDELIAFCVRHGLGSKGSKEELEKKIVLFLKTGKKPQTIRRSNFPQKDSEQEIKVNTKVVHYKNDQNTRDFFISQIGISFRFNGYLREFAKSLQDGSKTYGDLVEGYKKSLKEKNTTIDKQFQFNQFQRDFFANENNATRNDCLQAWDKVKKAKGPSNYQTYKKL